MGGAAKLDLNICLGATYDKKLIWQDSAKVPISLSAYEARMQVRATVDSAIVLLSLNTGNGKIILEPGGEVGLIQLLVGAVETEAIAWDKGVYDLEIYDPLDADVVFKLVKGTVYTSLEVTRP